MSPRSSAVSPFETLLNRAVFLNEQNPIHAVTAFLLKVNLTAISSKRPHPGAPRNALASPVHEFGGEFGLA